MGIVASTVVRKIQRFNVENRAHRLLDKEIIRPAPKYDANKKDIERSLIEDPDYLHKQTKKDNALDDRLKNVYVTSKDSFIDYGIQRRQESDKKLPADRSIVEEFEYGHSEPIRLTPGHCTLRQALKFITDNQSDPNLWTVQKISNDYKLKSELVENILLHFKSFQIYVPDVNKRENILTQASVKNIESGKETGT